MMVGQNKQENLLRNSTKSQCHKTFYSSMTWDTKSKKKSLRNSAKRESNKTFYSSMTVGKIS